MKDFHLTFLSDIFWCYYTSMSMTTSYTQRQVGTILVAFALIL